VEALSPGRCEGAARFPAVETDRWKQTLQSPKLAK